jgi:hypothetical protein
MTSGRRAWIRRGGGGLAGVLASVAAAMALAGCDDGATSSSPSGRGPTTTPAAIVSPASTPIEPATTAATTAEATQPASSTMNINGHLTTFPAARVRLESDGQNLVALLYSNDPREALKSNYAGNSFYLRMVLDIDDASKLNDARWTYTAPSSGAGDRDREADSPYGIFLGGRKIALQPFDVKARFKVEGGDATTTTSPPSSTGGATTVLLQGSFRILDESPGRGPAQVLPVTGELPVQVDVQR